MSAIQDAADKRKTAEDKWKKLVVDLRECSWKVTTEKKDDGDGNEVEHTYRVLHYDGQDHMLSDLAVKQVQDRVVAGLWTICRKSTSKLHTDLMDHWLPLTEEKKATVVLKCTDSKEPFVLGAVGIEQSDISTSALLSAVATQLGKRPVEFFEINTVTEGAIRWYRIVVKDAEVPMPSGDPRYLVLDLHCSDFAWRSLVLDIGVYDTEGTILARLANKPYFTNDYKGIQGADLEAAVASAVTGFPKQATHCSDLLRVAYDSEVDEAKRADLVEVLPRFREGSKGLMTKVAATLEDQKPSNKLAVADIIAEMAKAAERPQHRCQHEAFAGIFAGLLFVPRSV